MSAEADAIDKARRYSKSGVSRLTATWKACRNVDKRGIEGDLVECGVWRGGNVMVMRWASPHRVCWLYDTFDGITEPGKFDVTYRGLSAAPRYERKLAKGKEFKWMSANLSEVMTNFNSVGVYEQSKFRFIIGDVRSTLKNEKSLPEKIAVLRLDTDFYDSTKIEMEVLYPRLASGGILLVDDYGHWLGARKAVADYLGHRNMLKPIDYTGAWMVKE